MPATFCVLHKAPSGIMPRLLENSVDRVANLRLNGMTSDIPRVPFNSQNWWNGTFQHFVESWYRENFGFRRPALKLYNQFLFDVFHSSSMPYNDPIVIGKRNDLYEWSYVADACGIRPSRSQGDLQTLVADLAVVQRQFGQIDKDFIVLITPSKAAIIPEDIPPRLCPNGLSDDTNYRQLVPLLERGNIHFVDGEAITSAQKGVSGAPIFPLGGTHWGELAEYKVTDALTEMINKSPFGHAMPPLKIRSMRVDRDPRGAENDILDLLNLARPNRTSQFLHIDLEPATALRPADSLTFVGGSFTRGVIAFLASAKAADVTLFYYYALSREVWPREGVPASYAIASERNFAKDFLSSDTIVLEMNVEAIGGKHVRSFLDDALHFFSRPDQAGTAPADARH
jgi:hypothetical protein